MWEAVYRSSMLLPSATISQAWYDRLKSLDNNYVLHTALYCSVPDLPFHFGCLVMSWPSFGFLLSGLNAEDGAQIFLVSQSQNGGQRIKEDSCRASELLCSGWRQQDGKQKSKMTGNGDIRRLQFAFANASGFFLLFLIHLSMLQWLVGWVRYHHWYDTLTVSG